MVGYTRRNFMVPAPRFDSFDDFNAHLKAKCLTRQGDTLRGCDKTIGERLISDLDALMGLPVAEYEALDLSRFRAAPSARLSHLAFESDGAFPTQC